MASVFHRFSVYQERKKKKLNTSHTILSDLEAFLLIVSVFWCAKMRRERGLSSTGEMKINSPDSPGTWRSSLYSTYDEFVRLLIFVIVQHFLSSFENLCPHKMFLIQSYDFLCNLFVFYVSFYIPCIPLDKVLEYKKKNWWLNSWKQKQKIVAGWRRAAQRGSCRVRFACLCWQTLSSLSTSYVFWWPNSGRQVRPVTTRHTINANLTKCTEQMWTSMRNRIGQMKLVIALTDMSQCPASFHQQEELAPLESLTVAVPTLPSAVCAKPSGKKKTYQLLTYTKGIVKCLVLKPIVYVSLSIIWW